MNSVRRPAQAGLKCARRSLSSSARCRANESHAHSHQAQTESFGPGFYVSLGLIPTAYFVYRLSAHDGDKKSALTRWIESYANWKEEWVQRNDLHTKMIEQAAFDRNLFHNSKTSQYIEHRFPESFNMSSPYNVPAGHGSANLDELIAHYQKKNFEENEKKLQALRDGTLKAEQPASLPRKE